MGWGIQNFKTPGPHGVGDLKFHGGSQTLLLGINVFGFAAKGIAQSLIDEFMDVKSPDFYLILLSALKSRY